MAVYTVVSEQQLRAFLAGYDIGEPQDFRGIAEGVENSNFLLRTDRGAFILTLYEKRVARGDLPFFLGLMQHLAARGIVCPTPIVGRDGQALRELAGRPAAIVSHLQGVWPRRIHPFHCAEVGRHLARLHAAGADFPLHRPNDLSAAGWRSLLDGCSPLGDSLHEGLVGALRDEVAHLEATWPTGLPTGVIHADLFPDNVFFRDETLTGLIDFYFACNDFLAYDLAICLNAWCFDAEGHFNVGHGRLLLNAYAAERPLRDDERTALPTLARGAAVRFLLTRLFDWLHHPPGAFVQPKDPLEYWRKLQFHQQVADASVYGLA